MLNWAYATKSVSSVNWKSLAEGKSKSMRRLHPLVGVDNISIICLVAD